MRSKASASRLSSVSVSTRLAASIVTVSVLALLAATYVGVSSGRSLSQELDEDQLVGLRTTAALGVVDHFEGLRRAVTTVAASPQTPFAIDAFARGHEELEGLDPIARESLISRYRAQYLKPFSEAGIELDTRDIVSENASAVYLQSAYRADANETGDAMSIDDAQDDSEWSATHAVLHPAYREIVQRRRLVDLLLVEPENGYVVYSARKRPDLGTSLALGPFSGSLMADVVARAADLSAGGTVLADLSFYPPAGLSPVGAIASPVVVDGTLAGVVVLVYDSAPLTSILTADQDWDRAGYPPTGETFLIASDGTMRTDPRAFLEGPAPYVLSLADRGLPGYARRQIEGAATTVLVLDADPASVNAALNASTGAERRSTSLGEPALSSVGPIDVEGLNWFVVAEVSAEVIDSDLGDFQNVLIVGAAIFVTCLAFAAVAWSRHILRPVRDMSDRLGDERDSDRSIVIPASSPTEFHRLASSLESMGIALRQSEALLDQARRERLNLLHRILPPAVADRMANDDVQPVETVPNATVVVVVVRGLDALVRPDDIAASRRLVERLYGELDDIAHGHGVERVKVVGDAYFAVCGHDQPYVDHAPRALAFAAEAQDVIREVGTSQSTADPDASELELGSVVGLSSGSVTVGMAGANRLVYDVWGNTVFTAHHLARLGSESQILATRETVALMPDSTTCRRLEAGYEADSDRSMAPDQGDEPRITPEIWEIVGTSIGAAR